MTELDEMNRHLRDASDLLRQAVEAGLRARDRGPDAKRSVDQAWEAFLAGLLKHLRQRGKDRGENLLAGISFAKVMSGSR